MAYTDEIGSDVSPETAAKWEKHEALMDHYWLLDPEHRGNASAEAINAHIDDYPFDEGGNLKPSWAGDYERTHTGYS